jgi:imidazolonepropionase-like amidohydrolase
MGGFQYEVEAHVDIGMTPMEAIVSATSDSAKSCWWQDQVGSLEPGKKADVLVVDGDPSKDVRALWKVVDVFLGGQRVDRGNLV